MKNSSLISKKSESKASPQFACHEESEESKLSLEEEEGESESPIETKIKEDIEESIKEHGKIVVHVSQSSVLDEQIEMVF
mmetsp:Transcript_25988/g.39806  ORF Transcript_25988/g.39806 Transcript_25988/m.39806 type:complete len:80 (+) Transcript_25988:598-837(+)